MSGLSRNRLGWWGFVAVLAVVAALVGYEFLAMLTLGVFGYYATRPISERVDEVVESDALAAAVTVLTVLVPVFLVTIYAGLQLLQQLQRRLGDSGAAALTDRFGAIEAVPPWLLTSPRRLLRQPPSLDSVTGFLSGSRFEQVLGVLGSAFDTLLVLALATFLAYTLLRYDDQLAAVFVALAGGRETTAYTYALAVDDDLESIFYGNLLFALLMSVIATVTYAATNFFAPPGLTIPLVVPLGFLTGVASLIPLVVGKVVYLPVVAYLGLSAMRTGEGGLTFVGVALVGYVLLLDLLPQTFLQPYVTGQQLNTIILLFAYVLGPIFFGWYGLFLMPIVFVLFVEAIRIVLPELIHGEPLDQSVAVARDTGAAPADIHDDKDTASDDGGSGAPD